MLEVIFLKRAGHRIRVLRNERKWSQARLAYEAGISANYLSEIENGARIGTSLEKYIQIAEALDTPLWQIFLDTELSEVIDSIVILLADRPVEIQENILEIAETYLKGIDRIKSKK